MFTFEITNLTSRQRKRLSRLKSQLSKHNQLRASRCFANISFSSFLQFSFACPADTLRYNIVFPLCQRARNFRRVAEKDDPRKRRDASLDRNRREDLSRQPLPHR